MLRFFRLNDPYRLLALLALLTLLSLPQLIDPATLTIQELKGMLIGEALAEGKLLYAKLFDSTAPLSSFFFGLVNWLVGRSVLGRQFISLFIIFFQASFFAVILIRNKAYIDSTYVSALVFGGLCFLSFDFLSVSPELIGATLLLMALNNLFKEIEFKIQRDEIILNLGFYLGLASLCLFSLTVFFVGAIIILSVFTRINLRKYLLLFFGFTLPHILLICFYLYKDQSIMLLENFYLPNSTLLGEDLMSIQGLLTLLALPIVFLILAFLKLNNEGRFTKYQSQLSQVMFLWMVFAVVHVSITRELTPHSFIVFIPSFAYFITHYFLLIRRKNLAEVMFAVLLIGIIGISGLSRYNKISWLTFDAMLVKQTTSTFQKEKIMVVNNQLGYYQENKLAGYFLEWPLYSTILDEPDYYENVILIGEMFYNDSPDVIIDPEDKMKAFFKRIPTIASKYKREGELYQKISN